MAICKTCGDTKKLEYSSNCYIRGVYLEADHIKSWAQFPELRYAIDNGRTLCKECHATTESYPRQFVVQILRRIES